MYAEDVRRREKGGKKRKSEDRTRQAGWEGGLGCVRTVSVGGKVDWGV